MKLRYFPFRCIYDTIVLAKLHCGISEDLCCALWRDDVLYWPMKLDNALGRSSMGVDTFSWRLWICWPSMFAMLLQRVSQHSGLSSTPDRPKQMVLVAWVNPRKVGTYLMPIDNSSAERYLIVATSGGLFIDDDDAGR